MGGWIVEVLYSDPHGSRVLCGSFLQQGEVFAYFGSMHTRKNLQNGMLGLRRTYRTQMALAAVPNPALQSSGHSNVRECRIMFKELQ